MTGDKIFLKKFDYDDFSPNDAWLVFRLDAQVKDDPIDIYVLMDLPSGYLFGHFAGPKLPVTSQTKKLLNDALKKKSTKPKRLLISKLARRLQLDEQFQIA